MTDIDRQADLEVHFAGEHMTVRVPLAGPVTGEWLQHYQMLALAAEVRAQAGTHHDRAWIIVTVPASSDQGEVAATLDAARALMAEADAAERPPASVKAEAGVRDWWARSQGSAPRSPVSGVEAAGVQAEKRWPMAFTLVVAIAVPLLLPPRFSLGRSWAVPVASTQPPRSRSEAGFSPAPRASGLIAAGLFLSPQTIKSQAVSLCWMLGASSQSQGVTRAREPGLLEG